MDPEKSTFWVQSDLPEVQELTWILSNFTPMGLLERCHSYKDKIAKGIAPNHGLFAYPVLMTADILMFQSDKVPVGKDQKQHLEVARDIAIKVNNHYGELFVVPEPEIDDEVATVPGLDGQKMSKSYGNTIDLFLEEKALRKQVMRIVTDPTPVEEPKDPDTLQRVSDLPAVSGQGGRNRPCASATWPAGSATERSSRSCSRRCATSSPPTRERRQELLADPDGDPRHPRPRGRTRPATWPTKPCARCGRRRGWPTDGKVARLPGVLAPPGGLWHTETTGNGRPGQVPGWERRSVMSIYRKWYCTCSGTAGGTAAGPAGAEDEPDEPVCERCGATPSSDPKKTVIYRDVEDWED